MTDITQELLMRANDIVAQKQTKASKLKKELLEIETRKLAIDAELEATDAAVKRLLDFRPMLGSDYQCPDCFIIKKERVSMRPVPGSQTHDIFLCPTCNVELKFFIG